MTKHSADRREARGFLRNALMLIPNFLKLLVRLFKDSRVPLPEKALVIAAIVYVISPLDLIPDVIPFVGQVDDLYLVGLTILRLLTRTNGQILQEHWDGNGDVAVVVDRITRAAQYVLPKKVRHVLMGRVEIAPQVKGGLLSSPAEPEPINAKFDVGDAKRRRG